MSRALLAAAARGDHAKVLRLLAEGAEVDCVHKATGRTPLIEAAIEGHLDVVKALIEAGADVNRFDNAVGFTPLMWACEQRHGALVEPLLAAAADVNARCSEFGWTPLLVAAHAGSLPIVQRLLDAGADLRATTTDGRTTVALARAAKNEDVAARLEVLGCTSENTLPVPPSIPWPAVNAKASNVDFSSPESVVRGLIIAMNHFETNAPRAKTWDAALAQMNAVYARFCTDKKRAYGRNGSYQTPSEYDTKNEILVESKVVNPRRAELVTRNSNRGIEYLYVLQKKAGAWRVDSKKYRLLGGKWNSWHI